MRGLSSVGIIIMMPNLCFTEAKEIQIWVVRLAKGLVHGIMLCQMLSKHPWMMCGNIAMQTFLRV